MQRRRSHAHETEHADGAADHRLRPARLRDLRWAFGVSLDKCAAALGIGVHEFAVKERRCEFSEQEIAKLALVLETDSARLNVVVSSDAAASRETAGPSTLCRVGSSAAHRR